ncbi:DUF5995 family protein [Mycolicibacterium vaccae]|uniref:Uncharacterized protein n=1 Tax=Mycolicibacterium vaccae ATCC 25954 TaxID=1194972 RepID=K0UWV1_MYCVA|nr:DUF5995 family protein [Mycolicibacterium vaccae]ANI38602.1 hypothetical protein MYVA_1388 [Mycolicibacterium vaccae 95051]EJZ11281.1 hypothetical protein MVAC_05992 [Mycolicibacterium vaccae ATCC 25954]
MSASTVADVVARMRVIAAENAADDGAAVFNSVYLRVTESMSDRLSAGGFFSDGDFMTELTVRFANYWFAAYDAVDTVPKAWEPLLAMRSRRQILPIQFALAGMNAHIENDLPLAVLGACTARDRTPDSPGVRSDYDKVNDLLADAEAEIRRSFLNELERSVDDRLAPVAHLVSAWSIDKARDFAWMTTLTLWELQPLKHLYRAFLTGIGHTVGMGSRLLLTTVVPE